MSFAVLSPAFRGLQFPFRDMCVLTFDRNSFTGNNGRPSYAGYAICLYGMPLAANWFFSIQLNDGHLMPRHVMRHA